MSTTAPPVVETVPTTAPIRKTTLAQTLGDGSFGNDVEMVQNRLKELGFDPGPIDGQFGGLTRAAVWAFEKLVIGTPRDEATGQLTNEAWQRMQDPIVVVPRRPDAPTANHTEIYLPEQVVIFFVDDKPALITHMSSGTGEEWCEEVTISPGERGNENGTEPLKKGECGISNTPGGVFEYDRRVEGIRESGLGSMWNPVYFNYGIAIHGAMNVPLAAGLARLHPHPDDALQLLPDARHQRRQGVRVRRRQGARAVLRAGDAADVQLGRSRLHDDHDDDHRPADHRAEHGRHHRAADHAAGHHLDRPPLRHDDHRAPAPAP